MLIQFGKEKAVRRVEMEVRSDAIKAGDLIYLNPHSAFFYKVKSIIPNRTPEGPVKEFSAVLQGQEGSMFQVRFYLPDTYKVWRRKR